MHTTTRGSGVAISGKRNASRTIKRIIHAQKRNLGNIVMEEEFKQLSKVFFAGKIKNREGVSRKVIKQGIIPAQPGNRKEM